jgi:large subunit ribosomal protein L9
MRLILQEKIANLGNVGDQVTVKRGYGRNYLIPHDKAVVASPENIKVFELHRGELETNAAEALSAAQTRAKSLESATVKIAVQASEEGKLFGSVGPREIADAMVAAGHEVTKSELSMPDGPIRHVGEHAVAINLHSEVHLNLTVNVVAIVEE